MERAIFRAGLVLAGSIVFGAAWVGFTFRYDVKAWGGTAMVHDRLRGTVERCMGNGKATRCLPLLAPGMQPISPPTAKTTHKLTDQEFNNMMDRATKDFEAHGSR